MPRSLWLRGAS